jgi:hypothetical protein
MPSFAFSLMRKETSQQMAYNDLNQAMDTGVLSMDILKKLMACSSLRKVMKTTR